MKRILTLVPAISIFVILCAACSNGNSGEYKNDVPLSVLANAIETHLDPEALTEVPESYIKGMDIDTAVFAEYIVKLNKFSINIDEYGIFKAKDASQVKDVEKQAKDYLNHRLDTWMEGYIPEEKPKLENAETKTLGLYVLYVILPDDEKSAVISEFEKQLKIS